MQLLKTLTTHTHGEGNLKGFVLTGYFVRAGVINTLEIAVIF